MVASFRFSAVAPAAVFLALAAASTLPGGSACAAPSAASSDPLAGAEMTAGDPTHEDGATAGVQSRQHEQLRVRGRRSLPPGYQDAPSMEMTHGPDPDHLDHVNRDSVTGADLSRFGSSYQDSGPMGQGKLGDSTGNGWVTPR